MPSSKSSLEHKSMRPSGKLGARSLHTAIRRSCSELNWSRRGKVTWSQYHCKTAASSRQVGVSALYSSSLGGSTGSWYVVADSPPWAHPVVLADGFLIKDANMLARWSVNP
jgi:hypothetical protein